MTLRHDTAESAILIALGANLPNDFRAPEETLQLALADLAAQGFGVMAQSRFFTTPCFPAGAGPDYVNAAAVLRAPVGMGPGETLAVFHRIEADHGRARVSRWAGRTLDIDLLAWGESVLPDRATHDAWRVLPPERQAVETPDRLILPHPRLQDRAFVLVPLADVAPDWRHPTLDQSVQQMMEALPQTERDAVKPR